MSAVTFTPGPWTYGVRSDGSIWMSLGDPKVGAHHQFDWYGTEKDAQFVTAAPDLYAALDDLLRCMADCVFADKDPEMDVAEHNARAALTRARGETP